MKSQMYVEAQYESTETWEHHDIVNHYFSKLQERERGRERDFQGYDKIKAKKLIWP